MRALVGAVCVVLAVPLFGVAATPAGAATKTTLACKDFVATPAAPPASYSVVLDRVALPTGRAFEAVDARDPRPGHKYFAKQGLLVEPGARWLAFVGGFWVSKPACVPVTVKSAGKQRTVHIGAGKACPGQSPPPTA